MSKPKLAVIVGGNLAAAGPGDKDNIEGLGTAATGDVVQGAGNSQTDVMSQKATTDALTNSGSLASASATYEYDAQGRADKIVTPQGNTVIGYNPDGTVNTITYPTGRVETYTYDASGNVVSMVATGG